MREKKEETNMWAEKKEISCGGLLPLKLALVEDFIKICNLNLKIKKKNVPVGDVLLLPHLKVTL